MREGGLVPGRVLPKTLTLFMTKISDIQAEISLNWYPIYGQNSRKTIPFGAPHTYIAHIREYPPRGGFGYPVLIRIDFDNFTSPFTL